MLIDTHCHLDAAEFAEDRDALVQAAREVGVSGIIIPAISVKNFFAVQGCCLRYPECLPAYGLHPLYLDRANENDFDTLREWLQRELAGAVPPVAVGEIGLDYYVPEFDAAQQEYCFLEQLKIAREYDLPVLLHARRAVDQVLKGLRHFAVRGGVAHAFNGSRQQADEFIRLGFKLGFGGAMTYPGSTKIRQLATTLPLESIVLETDAPDIPTYRLAGGRNTPRELAHIAQVLADLRSLSLEEVLEATSANANSIMRRAV